MKNTTNEFSFLLKPAAYGVGLFAAHAIEKGTYLRLFGDSKDVRIEDKKNIPETHHEYCINQENGRVMCPHDFGTMSVGWYMNHSKDPNVYHKEYHWYAGRDIQAGEELLADYNSFDEPAVDRPDYYNK